MSMQQYEGNPVRIRNLREATYFGMQFGERILTTDLKGKYLAMVCGYPEDSLFATGRKAAQQYLFEVEDLGWSGARLGDGRSTAMGPLGLMRLAVIAQMSKAPDADAPLQERRRRFELLRLAVDGLWEALKFLPEGQNAFSESIFSESTPLPVDRQLRLVSLKRSAVYGQIEAMTKELEALHEGLEEKRVESDPALAGLEWEIALGSFLWHKEPPAAQKWITENLRLSEEYYQNPVDARSLYEALLVVQVNDNMLLASRRSGDVLECLASQQVSKEAGDQIKLLWYRFKLREPAYSGEGISDTLPISFDCFGCAAFAHKTLATARAIAEVKEPRVTKAMLLRLELALRAMHELFRWMPPGEDFVGPDGFAVKSFALTCRERWPERVTRHVLEQLRADLQEEKARLLAVLEVLVPSFPPESETSLEFVMGEFLSPREPLGKRAMEIFSDNRLIFSHVTLGVEYRYEATSSPGLMRRICDALFEGEFPYAPAPKALEPGTVVGYPNRMSFTVVRGEERQSAVICPLEAQERRGYRAAFDLAHEVSKGFYAYHRRGETCELFHDVKRVGQTELELDPDDDSWMNRYIP